MQYRTALENEKAQKEKEDNSADVKQEGEDGVSVSETEKGAMSVGASETGKGAPSGEGGASKLPPAGGRNLKTASGENEYL